MSYPDAVWEQAMTVREVMLKALSFWVVFGSSTGLRTGARASARSDVRSRW
jgi:hypothetical protein